MLQAESNLMLRQPRMRRRLSLLTTGQCCCLATWPSSPSSRQLRPVTVMVEVDGDVGVPQLNQRIAAPALGPLIRSAFSAQLQLRRGAVPDRL